MASDSSRKKVYDLLCDNGYTQSYAEFDKAMDNPDKVDQVYDLLRDNGYDQSRSLFRERMAKVQEQAQKPDTAASIQNVSTPSHTAAKPQTPAKPRPSGWIAADARNKVAKEAFKTSAHQQIDDPLLLSDDITAQARNAINGTTNNNAEQVEAIKQRTSRAVNAVKAVGEQAHDKLTQAQSNLEAAYSGNPQRKQFVPNSQTGVEEVTTYATKDGGTAATPMEASWRNDIAVQDYDMQHLATSKQARDRQMARNHHRQQEIERELSKMSSNDRRGFLGDMVFNHGALDMLEQWESLSTEERKSAMDKLPQEMRLDPEAITDYQRARYLHAELELLRRANEAIDGIGKYHKSGSDGFFSGFWDVKNNAANIFGGVKQFANDSNTYTFGVASRDTDRLLNRAIEIAQKEPDKLNDAQRGLLDAYYHTAPTIEQWQQQMPMATQGTRMVLDLLADPITYISGGAGNAVGKMATTKVLPAVARKFGLWGLGKATTDVAARFTSRTLAGRLTGAAASGAGNFAAFEGLHNLDEQYRSGKSAVDLGEFGAAALKGALVGGISATAGTLIGNVTNKGIQLANSDVSKLALKSAGGAAAFGAEVATFAGADVATGEKSLEDATKDAIGMVATFKIKGLAEKGAHYGRDAITQTLSNKLSGKTMSRQEMRRQQSIWRDIMDRLTTAESINSQLFSRDEREALKRAGYGDISDLLHRAPAVNEVLEAEVVNDGTGDKVVVTKEGKHLTDVDGLNQIYDNAERLIADTSIPESIRAKAAWLLTGKVLPMSTVTGYHHGEMSDGSKRYFVDTLNKDGDVVERRIFASEDNGSDYLNKVKHQIELNYADVGEQYAEMRADSEVFDRILDEEAQLRGEDIETLRRDYASKEDPKRAYEAGQKLSQIFEVAAERYNSEGSYRSAWNRPDYFREEIMDDTGVDVDKALKKDRSKRDGAEAKAVDDYLTKLYRTADGEEQDQLEEQKLLDTTSTTPDIDAAPITPPPGNDEPRAPKGIAKLAVDDLEVQVIDGDVAMTADARIDKDKSSKLLFILDPHTGQPKAISIDEIYDYAPLEQVEQQSDVQNQQDAPQLTPDPYVGLTADVTFVDGAIGILTGIMVDQSQVDDPNSPARPDDIGKHEVAVYRDGTLHFEYMTQDELDASISDITPSEAPPAPIAPTALEEELPIEPTDADGTALQAGDMVTDGTRSPEIMGADEAPPAEQPTAPTEPQGGARVPDGMTADRTISVAQRDGSTREYTVAKDQAGKQYVVDESGFMWGHDGNGENMKPYRPGESVSEWTDEQIARLSQSAQPSDAVPEQPEIVPTTAESGENAANIVPNPAETVLTEQPAAEPTPLQRVPKDANGEPKFGATDHETAWDALVEYSEGDAVTAKEIADAMVEEKKKALDKAQKLKLKGKTPAEMLASKKANAAELDKAQKEFEQWQRIAGVEQRRKDAERSAREAEARQRAAERAAQADAERAAREEAERIEREALNGVPEWHQDTPENARARGFRRFSGQKWERQEPLQGVVGKEVEVKFSSTDIPQGRIAVIEAGQLQPSHLQGERNPLFFIEEAQPKNRTDDISKLAAKTMAEDIRPQEITVSPTAYSGAPTVNTRGEVIQGNNRSDALRYLWENSLPEQQGKYKQFLIDNAEQFGIDPAAVEQMQQPVLVNMLDVDDAEAIRLGQLTAQDTESGGIERIKAKNVAQKLGDNMRTFANMLLRSEDEEASFGQLVDRNGVDVLKWMNQTGAITPTQYQSAFDSKGNLTAEAKNDLSKVLYQAVFKGANQQLEELFDKLPAKAQRAILSTAFRDLDSPFSQKMLGEIQASIRAYTELMSDAYFANAKKLEEVLRAVQAWTQQTALDDRFETVVPADNYSNFALRLAAMYKANDYSQKTIATIFNEMYDMIQGTVKPDLFNPEPDTTPRTLAEAIREKLGIDYQPAKNDIDNGRNGSTDVALDHQPSEAGQRGSSEPSASGEPDEGGEEHADGGGRAATDSEAATEQPAEISETASVDATESVQHAVEAASAEVNVNPTPAQAEAGNYKKGHITVGDFDITIENPAGSVRSGVDANGTKWETTMANTYGYIKGTEGVDGDHIDVFLAGDMDAWNGRKVFVVDQTKADGTFDEHKVMLGFNDKDEAFAAYLANYDKDWAQTHQGLRISEVNIDDFHKWIESSHRKTKPFADYSTVAKTTDNDPTGETISGEGYTIAPKPGDHVELTDGQRAIRERIMEFENKFNLADKDVKAAVRSEAETWAKGVSQDDATAIWREHWNKGPQLSDAYRAAVKALDADPKNRALKTAEKLTRNALNNWASEEKVLRRFARMGRSTDENKPTVDEAQGVSDGDLRYREVEDERVLDEFASGKTVKAYRTMQVIDGGLYSPMAKTVGGKETPEIRLGVAEQSEEHPEIIKGSNVGKDGVEYGVVVINKGLGKGTVGVAYNPYIHASRTALNDQFTSAHVRPNLVTVEVEIPESELASGYRAESAKNAVGEMPWHSGSVSAQLADLGRPRRVILSRYDKPIRILPYKEVAEMIAKQLAGTDIEIPYNVVQPQVAEELRRLGVRISDEASGSVGADEDFGRAEYITDEQIAQINARQRAMADESAEGKRRQVEAMSERLNTPVRIIENVEDITDADAEKQAKMRRSKGWYDTKTGEIVVNLSRNRNVGDVTETVLHEVVAHKGLRELVGEEGYSDFLRDVFDHCKEDVRKKIADKAANNGWDFEKATDEYLGELAEKGFEDFTEGERSIWQKLKSKVLDAINKLLKGIKLPKWVKLGDNELRYMLWRSHENLQRGKENVIQLAQDIVKRSELGLGEEQNLHTSEDNNGLLFRAGGMGDPEDRDKVAARDRYEKRIRSGWYQTKEALQDSMLGLKEMMQAVLKAEGKTGKDLYIEEVDGFENAYLGENRLSSVNQAEADAMGHLLFEPMLKEVAKLAKNEKQRNELTEYMMAKHGLERNLVMAQREYDAHIKKHPSSTKNIDDFRRDYSGLTALTGEPDLANAEAQAMDMVDQYEATHSVGDMWRSVKAVSDAIIKKAHDGGLIDLDTFNKIRSMYDFYIPLRGFDENTAEDVYAYLSSRQGASNTAIKTAKGRTSKADDPFTYLSSMAESTITQANRNKLVKQKFLNFVLNHPSDIASVSDLWIRYDDVTDQWISVFPDNINEGDAPDEVEQKLRDFEAKMTALAATAPDQYKKAAEAKDIPYRIVIKGNEQQHQVVVKRDGQDYVITINGNPRVAQAVNGQTNPDNDLTGVLGSMVKGAQWVNRNLSAFYTTRNPDFVASNFVRDMIYSNTIMWVKESPGYAMRFNRNVFNTNPAHMTTLYIRYNNGTLDMHDETQRLFYQFLMNGGETGFVNVRDIEKHRTKIAKEIKHAGKNISISKAMQFLGEKYDILNRSVENSARFAAFMTSRQMGRTIERAIYDAKEVSVNFNKKGAGEKFHKTEGETTAGNIASIISGAGRTFFVFWNAALQGTTNLGRQIKRHPAKALGLLASMFTGGVVTGALAALFGDDEYWDIPKYVRRSNIIFKVADTWIKIPLPIEDRAVYGLGELATSVYLGKERYNDIQLASEITGQVSQCLPVDFMEGGGGLTAFIPSAVKPVAETYIVEKSWTGAPLYKDTPWNKEMPEWTKAFDSNNKYLVNLCEVLNETSGGDRYTKGKIDINPAKLEYLLTSTFGGIASFTDKLIKTSETAMGKREYNHRNIPVINRLAITPDETMRGRNINNEFDKFEKEYKKTHARLKNYERDTDNGVFDYAEKIEFLNNSPEFQRHEIYETYKDILNNLRTELKDPSISEEERADLQEELNALKAQIVEQMRNVGK